MNRYMNQGGQSSGGLYARILLPLAALGLLGLLLAAFFINARTDALRQEATSLEAGLAAEKAKQIRLAAMKQEMEEDSGARPLAPCDNQAGVMTLLSRCLADAAHYSLDLTPPAAEDGVLRRRVGVQFTAGSLDDADAILSALSGYEYRCCLRDLSLTGGPSGIGSGPVSVTAELIFYELLE